MRRLLAPAGARLVTRAPGYLLEVGEGKVMTPATPGRSGRCCPARRLPDPGTSRDALTGLVTVDDARTIPPAVPTAPAPHGGRPPRRAARRRPAGDPITRTGALLSLVDAHYRRNRYQPVSREVDALR